MSELADRFKKFVESDVDTSRKNYPKHEVTTRWIGGMEAFDDELSKLYNQYYEIFDISPEGYEDVPYDYTHDEYCNILRECIETNTSYFDLLYNHRTNYRENPEEYEGVAILAYEDKD